LACDAQHLENDGYELAYLLLAAVFIAALVSCNLIFQKFFEVAVPLPGGGYYAFRQSVGLLAYPVTFLVTDVLSEAYGRRRTNRVVGAGFVASVFTLALVEVADAMPSADFGIGSGAFGRVFGASKISVFGSMTAYLVAQYLDVRLFHWWRRLTRGRHLWLRNNASTFGSQFVDSVVILVLFATFGAAGIQWSQVPELLLNALVFKWLFALCDTPFIYLAVIALRRRFPAQIRRVEQGELGLRPVPQGEPHPG
jgi:uncharacterized integral membrane protein (TIGR00697 family)